MKNAEKNVYFIYGINHIPRVGAKLYVTKVEVGGCSLGPALDREGIEIGPIQEIQQIGKNMSILWTKEAGYAVYWIQRS